VPHWYHVSTTLDGMNGRMPHGNEVDFDHEILDASEGCNLDPEIRFEHIYSHWKALDK
jgi:hypothetical protein